MKSSIITPRLHIPLFLCALLAAPGAFAQPTGTTDTWTGALDGNWADVGASQNWAGNNPPLQGDTLAFGATTGAYGGLVTNNFATATNFYGLTFNAGAVSYTLYGIGFTNSGALVDNSANAQIIALPVILGVTTNINVAGGGSLTVSNTISGAFGFTNIGAGLLTLVSNNTFTGPITISNGTLAITGAGRLNTGAYAGAISNGATFTFSSTNTQTLSGAITNTGALTLNGTNTETLSGVVNNSGSINVSGGPGTQTLSGTITNTGTIAFSTTAPGAGVLSGTGYGNGSLNENGPGALTISGNYSAYTGAVAVNGSELITSSGASLGGVVTVASGATNGVNQTSTGGQAIIGSLTFGAGTTYALFNFAQSPSTTTAPLLVTNLTFTGTPNVIVAGTVALSAGQYPLIKCGGTLPGTLPTSLNVIIPGANSSLCSLVHDTANNSIDLLVPAGAGNQITWAAGSGVWDINTTADWLSGTQSSEFVNGDYVVFADAQSGASPIAVTLNSTVSPGGVLFDNNLKTYNIAGTGTIAGTGGLTQAGANTTTLATTNTYTGATAVNAGTLNLDFTQAASPLNNIVAVTSPLSLGGGTLSLNSAFNSASSSSSTQTFASTAVASGSSVVTTNASSAAGAIPTIALGTLTGGIGVAVQFVGPAYNNGASSGTTPGGTTVPATATITATANTLLGGLLAANANTGTTGDGAAAYATVGLYDWAALSPGTEGTATSGAIVGGSQISGFYTAGGVLGANNVNLDITGNVTASGSTQYADQTWRVNAPGALTITLSTGKNVGNGGLLLTPNVGAANITIAGPGYWRPNHNSGGNTEFMIWQNNTLGQLDFAANAELVNGTSVSTSAIYTQAGPGTVVMGTANTYSGQNYLDGGVTVISVDAGLGAPATGAQVNLNGGTLMGNANFTLDNSGPNKRPVVLNNNGGGLAAASGTTMTVDGVVSGAGALDIGIPASAANGNTAGLLPGTGANTANTTPTNATGTVVLDSGANTYTGGTVLYSGTLNFSSGSLGSGGVTITNDSTLQWSNNAYDISAQTVTFQSGGATLDVNGNSVTLANSIGNGGSGGLTVLSTTAGGELTLLAANTYTGGTTVSSGTLSVNNTTGSGTGPGNVTAASGAALGGSGTISGNATWQSGASALFQCAPPGTPLTVSGTVTFNNNAVTVYVPGVVPLPVGAYTLLTAASISGTLPTNSPTYTGAGVALSSVSLVTTAAKTVTLTVTSVGTAATWIGSGNWSTGANWNVGRAPTIAGDSGTFGSGSSPVTLDVNETVGGLIFTNPASYTIQGSSTLTLDNKGAGALIAVSAGTANSIQTPISLNDNLTTKVGSGDSVAFTGKISSTGITETLALAGAGTTILSGANTYGPSTGTAGTTLSGAGTLQVGNSGALGAGDLDIVGLSGGTLQAGASMTLGNNIDIAPGSIATVDSQANALTLSGVVEDSGSLTKIGSGTLTLSGANTYSGQTMINAGVVSISADNNLGSTTAESPVVLNGGDLMGANGATLGRNINIGPASAGALGTNGLIDAPAGATFTIPTIIAGGNTGTNNLVVNCQVGSTGIVELEGANTYTGTTVISNGTLMVGAAGTLGVTTLNYNNQGGFLGFDANQSITAASLGGLTGTQEFFMTNSAGAAVSLTIGGNNTSTTFNGNLNDAGTGANLIMNGTGTVTLGNANYTGNTTVNLTGTLTINGGSFGSSASTITVGSPNNPAVEAAQLNINNATVTAGTVDVGTASNESGSGISLTGTTLANFSTVNMGVSGDYSGPCFINTSASVALGAFSLAKDENGLGPNSATGAGLVVSNGTVTANSVMIQTSGSTGAGTMVVEGGSLVIGNASSSAAFEIGMASDTRGGFLTMTGGSLTYLGTDGLLIGTAATPTAAALSGGTATLTGITLNQVAGAASSTLTLSGTNTTYLGSVGLVVGAGDTATTPISVGGTSTLGAISPGWSSSAPILLAGTPTIQTADSTGNPWPISLSGGVSGTGSLLVTGGGILTLSGTNNWTGTTTVSSGATLALSVSPATAVSLTSPSITVASGATFDVSAAPAFALGSGQSLSSYGTVNGSLILGSGSALYPGLNGTYGTNKCNDNLTMEGGATANFDLGTVYNQTNDLIVVLGTLALNGNSIHIKAPSTLASLDTTADYVLITSTGTITGSAVSLPVFDVAPANAANFTIVTKANTVVLHYNSTGVGTPPAVAATLAPPNLFAGQIGLVTATVTPGTSQTINSVTLNASSIGLSGTLPLVRVNSTDVFTNSFTLPNTGLQGYYPLSVTVTDGAGLIGAASLTLFVPAGSLWVGQGTDENWDTTANWLGGLAPAFSGSSVTFDGSKNRTPEMDNSYSVVGMTFDSTAGIFTINQPVGDNNGLTVSGGVTNNSADVETVNVPITAGAPMTIDAAAGNLVFPTNIDNGGYLLTVTGPTNTLITGVLSDTGGLTMAGAGTLVLSNNDTYTGNTAISAGTLAIGSYGSLNDNATAPAAGVSYTNPITIANGGTLAYNGTNVQTLTGVISGGGSLNAIGLLPYTGTNGTLILTGANTFTNNIIISNAWVSDDAGEQNSTAPTAGGLGNPQIAGRTVTINSNGMLSLDSGGNLFGAGNSAPAFTFVINQGGAMQITAGNTTIGPLVLNGGTLITGNYASTSTQYQPFELGSTVTVGGTSPSVITNIGNAGGGLNLGVLAASGYQTTFMVASTGSGGPDLTVWVPLCNSGGTTEPTGLIKAGPGTLALGGPNIYSSVTTLSNGILNLGVVETVGTSGPLGLSAASNPGSIVFRGGTLQYSAANQNDYSGRFSTAANQAFNIDTGGQPVTFATALASAGGSLTKLGAGTLTLSAANTYTGSTTISNGTLVLASTGSLASSTNITIAAGAVFNVAQQAAFTLGSTASLTASGAASPAGISGVAINLGSSPIILNYDGSDPALTISAGTLSLNGNAFTVNSASPLAVGAHVIIQQTTGNIISSGAYTVTGTAIGAADKGSITVSGSQVILNIATLPPPTISFSVNANNTSLSLSWSGYLGATLLYQSNAVGVGLQTNSSAWQVWPGSTTVTSEVIPIGVTNEVFFQLLYP
jgi:autotransporter-associated beta strand protein